MGVRTLLTELRNLVISKTYEIWEEANGDVKWYCNGLDHTGEHGALGVPTDAAPNWVDVDFPIIARTAVANNPSPVTLIGNITAPQWAVGDYSVCEGQELIHGWQEGTEVFFHCHVLTNGLELVDKFIKWEVEYTWATIDGAIISIPAIQSLDIKIPASTPDKTHLICSIGSFTPNAKIGTQVFARLKRIASTGAAPTANPWCTMLQLHIQCNTVGSKNISSK